MSDGMIRRIVHAILWRLLNELRGAGALFFHAAISALIEPAGCLHALLSPV
jgi:hypothetical protein